MSAALLARRASLAPAAAPRVAAGAPAAARIVRLAPVAAKKGEVLHIEVRSSRHAKELLPSGRAGRLAPARRRTRPANLSEERKRSVKSSRWLNEKTPPPTTCFSPSHFPLLTRTHSLQKQVQVGDEEAPEMAVKRFRRSAGNANVVMEVKRGPMIFFLFFLASEREKAEAAAAAAACLAPLAPRPQKNNNQKPHPLFFFFPTPLPPLPHPLHHHLQQQQQQQQAKRRRQFENSQDKAKRKDKEVRMRRSKKYQYQATTAEDSAASGGGPGALQPAPFAEFFSPAADAFVGSLTGARE